jgi:hypothetical protein
MGKPEFGRKVKMLKGKNVEINKRGKISKIKNSKSKMRDGG